MHLFLQREPNYTTNDSIRRSFRSDETLNSSDSNASGRALFGQMAQQILQNLALTGMFLIPNGLWKQKNILDCFQNR